MVCALIKDNELIRITASEFLNNMMVNYSPFVGFLMDFQVIQPNKHISFISTKLFTMQTLLIGRFVSEQTR